MTRELLRSLPVDFADVDATGRTLEGQVLRWDALYRVSDDGRRFYQEGFRRGAFAHSITARRGVFELRHEHLDVRTGLVGFTEADAGLMFRATLDHGDLGDDELAAVEAHRRRGVSVRYTPQANEQHAPPWWRTRVDVRELSLTARPQYGADAGVVAVRAAAWRADDVDALLDWQPPEV